MQDLIDSAMEYSVSNHPPSGLFTFIPSVDDDFLPDRYSTMMREGSFVKGKLYEIPVNNYETASILTHSRH